MANNDSPHNLTLAHCNKCGGVRNHAVVRCKIKKWKDEVDEDSFISGHDEYETLQCKGCDNIRFRHIGYCYERLDPYTDEPIPDVNYYPPAISRQKPDWVRHGLFSHVLDFNESPMLDILNEVYDAHHHGNRRLCMMSIRSLIESIMIDKVGDQGKFIKNLEEFHENGFISLLDRESLAVVLEAGHASTHRNYRPDENDLNTALDIMESLIQRIYAHGKKAESLVKRVPDRQKKIAKGSH